uniref:Janus kinase 2 n=1 Tax=Tetraselmis sp. GSL018 TaxID=582737 RepID=A0A061SIX9_9CHLO
MGEALGVGGAKAVHRAVWHGQDVVAILIKNCEDENRAAYFEQLGQHPALTQLLGMSRDYEGHQVFISEFAPMGSLDKVLRNLFQQGHCVSCLVLMQCAMQVCEGMQLMAENGLVHRNLALRNVLVFSFNSENQRDVNVKISDYGFTNDYLCYYCGEEKLPVRWMAPEALKRWQWSEKSDVWAFGVLLWELWSAARTPYEFCSDDVVAQLISKGERLQKPKECPDSVFALIEWCWNHQPAKRPTFKDLGYELLRLYASLDVTHTAIQEIPYEDLQVQEIIGNGSSKKVHRASWQGQDVAVMALSRWKVIANLKDFERLGKHQRLVKLLGTSWNESGCQVLVTEFAPVGSLDLILGDLVEQGHTIACLVLMECAMQICKGMEHLNRAGFIHRNLALRNVLVFGFDHSNHHAVNVKIADYGIIRENLCYHGDIERMPLPWMSPETLKKRRWSEKSDVWAFGVLLWELWTGGQTPYIFSDMSKVPQLVCQGGRLNKPESCPESVYVLMQWCWQEQPPSRPTFRELHAKLVELHDALSRS